MGRALLNTSLFHSLSVFVALNLSAANFDSETRKLKEQNHLIDKILISSDGQQFPCHAIILAAKSSYFKTLFTNSFNNSGQKLLNLPYSAATIRIILDLIYNKTFDEVVRDGLDLNTYLELNKFSDQAFLSRDVEKLKKAELFLHDNISDAEITAVLKSQDNNVLDRLYKKSKIEPVIIFRQKHVNCFSSTAVSKDGEKIVIGNKSNVAQVFKTSTGSELLTLVGHKGPVRHTAFSNDGTKIATASNDGTVKIWDAVNGKQLFSFSGNKSTHTDALAFSSDSTRITFYDNNAFQIFDLTNKSLVSIIPKFSAYANSAAFCPDGSRIVISHDDNGADVFDTANGKNLLALRAYSGCILSAVFNNDGTKIILTGDLMRVFDASSGELLHNFWERTRAQFGVWNNDGTKILIGSDNGVVKVFDGTDFTKLLELHHDEAVYSGYFIGETKIITTSSHYHQVWVLPPRELYDFQFLIASINKEQWFIVKFQLENYLKNLKSKPCYKDFMEKGSRRSKHFIDLLNNLIIKNETLKTYLSTIFNDFEFPDNAQH